MESLFFLVPVTLLLVSIAVAVFFWAMRSGQFDDLDSPAWRILHDDETQPPRSEPPNDDQPRP
ncbi:MAG TPA: cbb3-type cytochrome oxidase assembly protein CcoS [Immundisolibacter sp.]|nr:cbb3-type cytochrome oxidase assembly protein CcoS [Immundisolibacter sp.]